MKEIIYGICGIGNGHLNRQLPVIEELSKRHKVMVFGYGESLKFFSQHYTSNPNISVAEVAVPFYVGNSKGLDFAATASLPINQKVDYLGINSRAFQKAAEEVGKPDLVISDYEPVSAQYAYAFGSPLVTIDQQSKFLYGDLPKEIKGLTFQDEVARLHMFFPKAAARLACSFFDVQPREAGDRITLVPPTIRESIIKLKRAPLSAQRNILVYLSSARDFPQPLTEVVEVLTGQEDAQFETFLPKSIFDKLPSNPAKNISIHPHGDQEFFRVLSECNGIISTAGHSLLSEAMFLGIPVYAVPVSPYEQYLNAQVIDRSGFGISEPNLNRETLGEFIANIPQFTKAIKEDKSVLMRGVGQEKILEYLGDFLNKGG